MQFDMEMEIAREKVEDTKESTKHLAEIEETPSNRGVKRESDEDADSPSPIKVARKEGLIREPKEGLIREPNSWDKSERVKLLSHILKYMTDPTRDRDRGADLEINVLSKVSPHLAENPVEARKLDELTTQYYR